MRGPVVDILTAAMARDTGESSDFDLNPEVMLAEGRELRPAAVLIAIWFRDGKSDLILTKRASHLKHHPGQIAFPGGKVDATDASAEAAALREAREEIGLPEADVQIIGCLAPHETVTGFTITPVLATVSSDFRPVPEAGEVDEVFTVPLAHVLVPENYAIERRLWRGEWRRFYVLPHGPYYIWGATARILRALAERTQP